MTTKLRYQMSRDELIEEALLLHFQKYPVLPKEPVPVSNPRIDYIEQTFRPSPPRESPPVSNPRIEYLEQIFSERQPA